jgi:hypothetical protein
MTQFVPAPTQRIQPAPASVSQGPFPETMLTPPITFKTRSQSTISVQFVYKKDGTGYRHVFTTSASNKGPFFTYTKNDKDKKIVYIMNGKRYESTVWPTAGSEPQ